MTPFTRTAVCPPLRGDIIVVPESISGLPFQPDHADIVLSIFHNIRERSPRPISSPRSGQ